MMRTAQRIDIFGLKGKSMIMRPFLGKHLALKMALLMAFLSLIFPVNPCGAAVDASAEDDAYHYMKNGIDDQLYQEWWRFCVLDNETQLMLFYLLSDPDNISQNRKIEVQALVMQEGQPAAFGAHQSGGFGGDRRSPMLEIDGSGFSPQGESDLHVWGSVESSAAGGEVISWDLTFHPMASPWFAVPVQARLGLLPGDWIKWLVYMPSSQARGNLTIGNRSLDILGKGYHDHAWGRFELANVRMTTAWAAEPLDGFSLSFGEITGEQRLAFLGVEKEGKSIVFPQNKIKVTEISSYLDNETGLGYPSTYRVEAESGEHKLNFTVDVLRTDAIRLDFIPPQTSRTIFHQRTLLRGNLTSRSGEAYEFAEEGLSTFWASPPLLSQGEIDGESIVNVSSSLNLSSQNQTPLGSAS